jgi:RimJ/RimL family protein N-acetyltransferase
VIIKSKAPAACSREELRAFYDLVASEGEVKTDGLKDRISRAEVLAFLENGGRLVGVGALKRQHPNYRDKVFKKADAKSEARNFDLELGWVVVDKAHRGRGYSRLILDALLSRSGGRCVYATSASANQPMHKTLAACDFERDGQAWSSQERNQMSLCKFAGNNDPLRGDIAFNSDPP